ncbi:MAG: hypothetical protein ACI9OU_001691 [Candidatus Promineifilaceae bacterium]|jgi:hypothetical protein
MVAFAHSRDRTPARTSVRAHTLWGCVQLSGYRYYRAELGRWLNRDPLGEEGSAALRNVFSEESTSVWQEERMLLSASVLGYVAMQNSPVMRMDSLGVYSWQRQWWMTCELHH